MNDIMKMSEAASPDANSIIANLEMTGIKFGPGDGTISFEVEGIESGTVTVTVTDDGSTRLSKTITVTAPGTPITATPTPTTTIGGTTYTTGGGTTGGTVSPEDSPGDHAGRDTIPGFKSNTDDTSFLQDLCDPGHHTRDRSVRVPPDQEMKIKPETGM